MAVFDAVIDLTLDEERNESTGDFNVSEVYNVDTSDEEEVYVTLTEQRKKERDEEQSQEEFTKIPCKKIKQEIKTEDLMSYSGNRYPL